MVCELYLNKAVFKKGPVLCVLRSVMSVLVTANDVWNSKGDKKCFDEAL